MNIYQFMSGAPWLTFFILLGITQVLVALIKYPLRTLSIRKSGWPPKHLDADGDFKDGD